MAESPTVTNLKAQGAEATAATPTAAGLVVSNNEEFVGRVTVGSPKQNPVPGKHSFQTVTTAVPLVPGSETVVQRTSYYGADGIWPTYQIDGRDVKAGQGGSYTTGGKNPAVYTGQNVGERLDQLENAALAAGVHLPGVADLAELKDARLEAKAAIAGVQTAAAQTAAQAAAQAAQCAAIPPYTIQSVAANEMVPKGTILADGSKVTNDKGGVVIAAQKAQIPNQRGPGCP